MVNNILIISSDFTGHGHKSITESLSEKFAGDSSVKIHVVDGFSLGGNFLLNIGKSYGPITRNIENLWQLVWDISCAKPTLINGFIELLIKDNFIKLIKNIKPDLILSVHPNFNGSIMNILEKNKINIPVVTFIADLVSISPLWADPRVEYIISPTQEAKEKCMGFGVSSKKIKVLGFPVRSRFCRYDDDTEEHSNYKSDVPLKCLMMSGGEGVGNMSRIAQTLLDNINCTIKIVAGRNAELKNILEQKLIKKYGDRVKIYGFTKNIQDLMLDSDIAITRGSPNVMLEAISCNIPLVITGALPGQEEENPKFVEEHNLGVVCSDVENIHNTIKDLLKDNAQKLSKIRNSQRNYNNPNVAKNIVNFILNIESKNNEYVISDLVPTEVETSWYRQLKEQKLAILTKAKHH